MKLFDTYTITNRLLRLAPYAMNLAQFGLLLYLISPALRHIGWLYTVTSIVFMGSLFLSMAAVYTLFKRDKFQAMMLFVGQPKDRLYDAMTGIAGLLIGFAFHDFAVVIVAALTTFNGISGFFFPNPMNRR